MDDAENTEWVLELDDDAIRLITLYLELPPKGKESLLRAANDFRSFYKILEESEQ